MPLCNENTRLLVILGPTATGKSALAIKIAGRLPAEIISGDSMTVYRGLDIGTAKPTVAERQAVRHHLIDIREPNEKYSVAEFQQEAQELVAAIQKRGRLPIIVGGTGLYLQALLESYQFGANSLDEDYRFALGKMAECEGTEALWQKLAVCAPEVAAVIDRHNTHRLIRALEMVAIGENPRKNPTRPAGGIFPGTTVIGLNMAREELYRRIEKRVDSMIAQGWVTEVQNLLIAGVKHNSGAMQAIGYKELSAYLHGEMTLPEAAEKIKIATRHFAKRQLTWFRRMPYIEWLDAGEEPDKLCDMVCDKIWNKN